MTIARKAVLCMFALPFFGCSADHDSPSQTSDLTKQECDAIGGRIVEGIGCATSIPKDEMKKMCEKMGMKYSEKHDGCIE